MEFGDQCRLRSTNGRAASAEDGVRHSVDLEVDRGALFRDAHVVLSAVQGETPLIRPGRRYSTATLTMCPR